MGAYKSQLEIVGSLIQTIKKWQDEKVRVPPAILKLWTSSTLEKIQRLSESRFTKTPPVWMMDRLCQQLRSLEYNLEKARKKSAAKLRMDLEALLADRQFVRFMKTIYEHLEILLVLYESPAEKEPERKEQKAKVALPQAAQEFWFETFSTAEKGEWKKFVAAYKAKIGVEIEILRFKLLGPTASSHSYISLENLQEGVALFAWPFSFQSQLADIKRDYDKVAAKPPVRDRSPSTVGGFVKEGDILQAIAHGHLKTAKSILQRDPAALSKSGPGGRRPLHVAAITCQTDFCSFLIESKADPNAQDAVGMTALDYALEWDDVETFTLLLRSTTAKPDLSAIARAGSDKCLQVLSDHYPAEKMREIVLNDRKGEQPLHVAAAIGSPELVQKLLSYGADPNAENKNGKTPLVLAVASDSSRAVEVLMRDEKTDINKVDRQGGFPLAVAIKASSPATVQAVLAAGKSRGLNLKQKNEQGLSVAHFIASRSCDDVKPLISILTKSGISFNEPDAKGRTPLHHAVLLGATAVADDLVSVGRASADAPDYKGDTPLIMAASKGDEKMVHTLASHGDAKKKNSSGQQAIHMATTPAVVARLLQFGVDVNARDFDNRTPLFHAVARGREDLVTTFVAKGASVAVVDSKGVSVLSAAIQSGQKNMPQCILRAAEVAKFSPSDQLSSLSELINHPDERGWSPAHVAAATKAASVVKLLGDKGANLNAIDQKGNTPMHIAVAMGSPEVIGAAKASSSGGALSLVTQNNEGLTPMTMAIVHGKPSFVDQILASGGASVITQPDLVLAASSGRVEEERILIRALVKESGGHDGKLSIALSWTNYNDLDLHVVQPSGRVIYCGDKKDPVTGGWLDVDKNISPQTDRPVEQVFFESCPAGDYSVFVVFFSHHNHPEKFPTPDPSPFRIVLTVNNEAVLTLTGEVHYDSKMNGEQPELSSHTRRVHVVTFTYSSEGTITKTKIGARASRVEAVPLTEEQKKKLEQPAQAPTSAIARDRLIEWQQASQELIQAGDGFYDPAEAERRGSVGSPLGAGGSASDLLALAQSHLRSDSAGDLGELLRRSGDLAADLSRLRVRRSSHDQ